MSENNQNPTHYNGKFFRQGVYILRVRDTINKEGGEKALLISPIHNTGFTYTPEEIPLTEFQKQNLVEVPESQLTSEQRNAFSKLEERSKSTQSSPKCTEDFPRYTGPAAYEGCSAGAIDTDYNKNQRKKKKN